MTGGIAHDFRNILAVIDSGLRLIETSHGDPNRLDRAVIGTREAVDRGVQLTDELLAFAKQPEFSTCALDANDLLKALDLFLRYGAGAAVRVHLDLGLALPMCTVDPSQFSAAVLNLVINARDAMPNGGEVRISTTYCLAGSLAAGEPLPRNYVRVRVKDNGVGMPDDVLHRMSQPFFTTKGKHGTGLGVPQVCAVMRHIGGLVHVSSEQGKGTTFDLLFRAVDGSAPLTGS